MNLQVQSNGFLPPQRKNETLFTTFIYLIKFCRLFTHNNLITVTKCSSPLSFFIIYDKFDSDIYIYNV